MPFDFDGEPKHQAELAKVKRTRAWAIAAVAVVAWFAGRSSAPDPGPARSELKDLQESSAFQNQEFFELGNSYADLADDVGRPDLADEIRNQYEPREEDFTQYP